MTANAHNVSYGAHLDTLGEVWELLDTLAMREMTGSPHYLSGLYTPGTVMLQPAGFVRGMADGLRRDGVEIYENTPALGFAQTSGNWVITTPAGKITAGKVILTVNGHLESFGFARGRIMQLFLFATMTPDLGADALNQLGGHSRWGITPSDPMGTTLRRIDTAQGGNRIVTRTAAALRTGLQVTRSDMSRAAAIIQKKFDERFPQLAGMKMEHTWAGHLALSMNAVSVTREVAPNVWSGFVQNGLGTARGTLIGIAAAEMACGIESNIARFFAGEAEPSKLPPQPFRDIGANVVLRWKEWKARAD